jgi:hypothetical protein
MYSTWWWKYRLQFNRTTRSLTLGTYNKIITHGGYSFLGYSALQSRWVDRRFRDMYCLHHQGDKKVCLLQQDYTLYSRKLSSPYSPPWEPEISEKIVTQFIIEVNTVLCLNDIVVSSFTTLRPLKLQFCTESVSDCVSLQLWTLVTIQPVLNYL